MNAVRILCAAGLVLGSLAGARAAEPVDFVPPWIVAARGNNEFATDLYARLAKQDGNVFFSPYSVSAALAMTYAGARGETAAEMAKTLHFLQSPEHFHPAMADLSNRLLSNEKDRKFQLHIANRLWPRKGLALKPEFVELSRKYYGAAVEPLDFAGATEKARQTINRWTSDHTEGRIPELIRDLHPETQMALTNAVYFKAAWAQPFDVEATKPGPFLTAEGKKVEVPLMHGFVQARHFGDDELDVVIIPYENDQARMILFVPRAPQGLAAVEKRFTAERIREWLGRTTPCQADLFLPRFKTSAEFELSDTLTAMGMKRAFSPGADFSGIADDGLYITRVIHQAYVDVNEAGTEAAAATAVLMERGVRGRRVVVRADHPFAFAVQDGRTGSLVFMGRMNNPDR